MNQQQFRVCFLADPFLNKESVSGIVKGKSSESQKRMLLYIDTPDKGDYYEGNGNAHMLMRDAEIIHEYRVREGNGGFEWFLKGLPEIVLCASNNFHK